MPYSLLIRSWMISMCSSPIPHRMVWGWGVIRQLVDSLWLRWSWLIPWWYYYLAGIRVNPDFKTGVFSLEAAECVLKIYQEEIQCVSDGKLAGAFVAKEISMSLTSLFGHGGRLNGAEEDGIRDLHPWEDHAGLLTTLLPSPAVILGSAGCGCCRRLRRNDGVPGDCLQWERKT